MFGARHDPADHLSDPGRPPQADGRYTAPITFTLNVADSLSGNPQAYYRINGGAWQNGLQLQVTTDGSYQIEYFGRTPPATGV